MKSNLPERISDGLSNNGIAMHYSIDSNHNNYFSFDNEKITSLFWYLFTDVFGLYHSIELNKITQIVMRYNRIHKLESILL